VKLLIQDMFSLWDPVCSRHLPICFTSASYENCICWFVQINTTQSSHLKLYVPGWGPQDPELSTTRWGLKLDFIHRRVAPANGLHQGLFWDTAVPPRDRPKHCSTRVHDVLFTSGSTVSGTWRDDGDSRTIGASLTTGHSLIITHHYAAERRASRDESGLAMHGHSAAGRAKTPGNTMVAAPRHVARLCRPLSAHRYYTIRRR